MIQYIYFKSEHIQIKMCISYSIESYSKRIAWLIAIFSPTNLDVSTHKSSFLCFLCFFPLQCICITYTKTSWKTIFVELLFIYCKSFPYFISFSTNRISHKNILGVLFFPRVLFQGRHVFYSEVVFHLVFIYRISLYLFYKVCFSFLVHLQDFIAFILSRML